MVTTGDVVVKSGGELGTMVEFIVEFGIAWRWYCIVKPWHCGHCFCCKGVVYQLDGREMLRSL